MTARFVLVCLIALASGAATARAETLVFHTDLSGAAEMPPSNVAGTGHLKASYDTLTKDFEWTVDYRGLTGPAVAAQFQAQVPLGSSAELTIPVTGSLEPPIQGKTTLTDAQGSALTSGRMWFDIRTEAHKQGEIRGQLEKGT
jgi:hypothetical protein